MRKSTKKSANCYCIRNEKIYKKSAKSCKYGKKSTQKSAKAPNFGKFTKKSANWYYIRNEKIYEKVC